MTSAKSVSYVLFIINTKSVLGGRGFNPCDGAGYDIARRLCDSENEVKCVVIRVCNVMCTFDPTGHILYSERYREYRR